MSSKLNAVKKSDAPEAPQAGGVILDSAHPGPIHLCGQWVRPGKHLVASVDDALRAELARVGRVQIFQAA